MGKKITKLFNKNFLLLWQGQVVSSIGSQVAIIAIALWIKDRLDSASVLGLSMMLHSLIVTIVSPFSGALVDNVSRKKLIVFSDIFAGIITIAVAIILFTPGVSPAILIVMIVAYDVLDGIASSVLNPSVMAIIPDIVPKKSLEKANSMIGTGVQLAVIGGQAIGGLLFKILGAPLLMLVNGISYFFSAFSEMFITVPDDEPATKVVMNEEDSTVGAERSAEEGTLEDDKGEKKEKFTVKKLLSDLKFGFIFVYKEKGIRNTVFGFALINLFLSPFMVLLPFYVEDYLNVGEVWYGTLLSVFAVGMFLGFILASIKVPAKYRGILMGVLWIIFAILTGALAFILHIAFVMVAFIYAGAVMGFFGIIHQAVLQGVTPKNFRGRVFSLVGTISGGLMPIGMGLSGIIADLLDKNIPIIFAFSGVTVFITSIFLFFNKHSIKFFAFDAPVEEGEESSEEAAASSAES